MVRYMVLGVLCVAAMIAYIHRSCISVPAGLIEHDLKLSQKQMGQIMSAFYLGYALMQIPSGWLGDRLGTRLALFLFILGWSLATTLMGLAWDFVICYALWLTCGMFQAGIFPSSVNTIAHWFPVSERGFPSGMLGSFMSIGAAMASAVSVLVLTYFDWPALFVILAIPGILFAGGFFLWFRNRPAEHSWVNQAELDFIEAGAGPTRGAETRQSWKDLAGNPLLHLVCMQQFFRAACYIFYVTWFPTFLQKSRGASLTGSGLLTSLPLLSVVLGSTMSGLCIDRIWRQTGSRRLSRHGVGLASVLGAGSFLVLAFFADSLAWTVGFITASAICAGCSGPAGYTVTMDLAGGRVATVFSVMNMAGNLGAYLLPLAVVVLVDWSGWNEVLLLLAVLYAAAALCWLLLFCLDVVRPMPDPA
jgi:ACS family D-galactonate transporter-like MFS transporter